MSVVTNAYRQAVDQYVADPENYHLAGWLAEEVYKVGRRRCYCTGFYYGRPDQCYLSGGYVRECDIVAVVDHCADGWLLWYPAQPVRCGGRRWRSSSPVSHLTS